MSKGHVTAHLGPMFSGKSSESQRIRASAVFRRKEAVLIIPAMDTRYSRLSLNVSHDGSTMSAMRVANLADVSIPSSVDIVIIDEAQFLPGLATFCIDQKLAGKNVHVFGLQSDKDGKAWPNIAELIVTHHDLVDSIEYCYADCIVCCARASYNIKVAGNKNELVELGGDDMYAPVCFEHFRNQEAVTKQVLERRHEDVKRVKELKNST